MASLTKIVSDIIAGLNTGKSVADIEALLASEIASLNLGAGTAPTSGTKDEALNLGALLAKVEALLAEGAALQAFWTSLQAELPRIEALIAQLPAIEAAVTTIFAISAPPKTASPPKNPGP